MEQAHGRMGGGFLMALVGVLGWVVVSVNPGNGLGQGLSKGAFVFLQTASGAVVLGGVLLMALGVADYSRAAATRDQPRDNVVAESAGSETT